MENKKFQVYIVFFILTIILISSYGFPIDQNKSKMHSPNLYKYNKSLTVNSNLLSHSEIDEGNQTLLHNFLISNYLGLIKALPTGVYTSYNGGNITIAFSIKDLDFSNRTVLDINNSATYLISYTKTTGTTENGTISNQLSFINRGKKYSGILDTSILSEGNYTIIIEIDLLNYYFIPFNFTLVLKPFLALEMISISDIGGILGVEYSQFIESNLTVEFKLLEMDFNISEVLDINNSAIYLISYFNTSNSEINGTLSSYIKFDNETETYSGIIETHVLSIETYRITIDIDLFNKTFEPYSLRLRVRKKYELLFSIYKPNEIIVGEKFVIDIFAEYNNEIAIAEGIPIKIILYINNVIFDTFTLITDSMGYVRIDYYLPMKTEKISIVLDVVNSYKYEETLLSFGISVISHLEIVTTLILIIGLILGSIFILISMYNRFIAPKKREKIRITNKLLQLFEDISKIDHIFIIFKRNGKLIFQKSYISKKKNQEKINKYIPFLSITEDPKKSQNLLSETTYEGKILLLANGMHIRACLILNKEGSMILKNNLKEFIYSFENYYENVLETWQDNLIPYKEIEKLFEDKMNIFIILPYKIEDDTLNKILFLKPDSKNLLNMTKYLVKETGMSFFYISTLLKEFMKRSHKGIAQFFMTLKELRNNQIISPIYGLDLIKESKGRGKLDLEDSY